jgi:hypothetical protein
VIVELGWWQTWAPVIGTATKQPGTLTKNELRKKFRPCRLFTVSRYIISRGQNTVF